MKELQITSNPSRRKFVTRLLGGAAVVVALFAMSASQAQARAIPVIIDNLYQAVLLSPTGPVGVAQYEIVPDRNDATDICRVKVTYTLTLNNKHWSVTSGEIVFLGLPLFELPLGTPALITNASLLSETVPPFFPNPIDMGIFLEDLSSQFATVAMVVNEGGGIAVPAAGTILPAVNTQPLVLFLNPCGGNNGEE
jgi:hypothetical protein